MGTAGYESSVKSCIGGSQSVATTIEISIIDIELMVCEVQVVHERARQGNFWDQGEIRRGRGQCAL